MNGGEMGPFRGSQLPHGGGESWIQARLCPQADRRLQNLVHSPRGTCTPQCLATLLLEATKAPL